MAQHAIDLQHPLDLLDPDPSTNPTEPCAVYLMYDPRDDTLWIREAYSIDGTPEDVSYGRVLSWLVPDTTDACLLSQEINDGRIDEWLDKIREGFSTECHGSNRRGVLSLSAHFAYLDLYEWLDGLAGTLDGGIVEAADWLYPIDVDLKERIADGSDLDALADELEDEARDENVVLVGTKRYLASLKEQA